MVDYKLTLVDIVLGNYLLPIYRFYLIEKRRKKYVHLTRYFDFIMH